MKITKLLLLLNTASFFTLAPFSAKAKDCSDFRILSHKWNMCKADMIGFWNDDKSTNSNETKKNETKKKGKGLFKNTIDKIKNLGGENIGEEG